MMSETQSMFSFGSYEWAMHLLAEFPDGHPGVDWHAVARVLSRRVRELERKESRA
jgi:hypothetical protein